MRWLATFFIAFPAWAQDYRFPLEPTTGSAPYVTAYRDLASGGGIQDWNCGGHAYDGHRGTDIGIGGFAVMDAGSRWVVAAAPGEVSYVVDGCYDRCTTGRCGCGGGFGNYVRITHADGKSTYYGHLLNGSVQVQNGQKVACGDRLGKVGSSGNSTGPHLHFEPRYSNNVSDDPYAGDCGGPTSFWVSQGDYRALPDTTCDGEPMPPMDEGVVKGVVWDRSLTEGPSDPGNQRVAGALVEIIGGPMNTARASDAFWSFRLAAGDYRARASATGFESNEVSFSVVAGQDTWSSIGLVRSSSAPPERDDAEWLSDTVLMAPVAPGSALEKSWTVRNSGTTTWTAPAYRLVFDEGEAFSIPEIISLNDTETVAPGESKTWTVVLTAPDLPGVHRGRWTLERAGVRRFGPTLEAEVTVAGVDPLPEDPRKAETPVDGGCQAVGGPVSAWLGLLAVWIRGRRRAS